MQLQSPRSGQAIATKAVPTLSTQTRAIASRNVLLHDESPMTIELGRLDTGELSRLDLILLHRRRTQ